MIEPASLLRVAIGGAVGTLARHLLLEATGSNADNMMLLAINAFGSLLLGLLVGRSLDDRERALYATGLCGGFTSFSSFAVSAAQSLDEGAALVASREVIVTTVVAIASVGAGLAIADRGWLGTPQGPGSDDRPHR